ncbi:type II toxin-antitoxin system MqsA family antitoxin [Klebsiella aerogenes]|nr:type II toxin-antitoxin system MqsA family antitoxin [Klebsiella aerogenes]
MKRYSLCPICGDEGLHETKTKILREFEGFKKEVPFHASVCESCGSETLTVQQAKFNKRQMTDFYREADGLLTGGQIKAIREDLRLTQSEAAIIFGGGKNAFTKYENGDVTQSFALDKLLRTAYSVPAAFEFLRKGCPAVTTVEYTNRTTELEMIKTYLVSKTGHLKYAKSPAEDSVKVVIQNYVSEPTQHNTWHRIETIALGSKL